MRPLSCCHPRGRGLNYRGEAYPAECCERNMRHKCCRGLISTHPKSDQMAAFRADVGINPYFFMMLDEVIVRYST